MLGGEGNVVQTSCAHHIKHAHTHHMHTYTNLTFSCSTLHATCSGVSIHMHTHISPHNPQIHTHSKTSSLAILKIPLWPDGTPYECTGPSCQACSGHRTLHSQAPRHLNKEKESGSAWQSMSECVTVSDGTRNTNDHIPHTLSTSISL